MSRLRGNLRTYWQIKLKHLERGNVVEQRFSPDDNVEKVILFKEEYEYLYRDGECSSSCTPRRLSRSASRSP